MLYICDKADICKNRYCSHRVPHELHCWKHHKKHNQCNCDGEDTCIEYEICSGEMGEVTGKVRCIPIFDDFIEKKEMEI